ncbi:hypothetical protein JXA85_06625 [Candidatus Woesearchaeota archaeon]|nr:hypothetical protein [Candidatus Woesearchaeota archaeon]
MSFVVTNGKIFREFDTLEQARKFFSENDSFGLEIKERDSFGNLRRLEKGEIESVESKQEPVNVEKTAAIPEPKKELEQQGYKIKSLFSGNALKYGIMIALALILVFVFIRIVLPMLSEFSKI